MTSARRNQGSNSVNRMSHRSTKQLSNREFNSVNQSKMSYKPQKAHLKIFLTGHEGISPSPNSARAYNKLHNPINKFQTSSKATRNLKCCKSVRNIGPKGSNSTRSKRGANRCSSTKSYK
mgnify:FL=1